MSFQEFLLSADPTLKPIDLPNNEKPITIEWVKNDQHPTTFLPNLRHNSLYADPLSECSGHLRIRRFSVHDRGSRLALCEGCEKKVNFSITQFLLARGLV